MVDITSIEQESVRLRQYVMNLFVGDLIGSGAYRRVYALLYDRLRVVKVEHTGRDFCNIHEYQVWKLVQDTPIEQWFAPCHDIDCMGIALIQSRTHPFIDKEEFDMAVAKVPGKKLPSFFDDVHYGNFGLLDGRLVCHDYGFTHFLKNGVDKYWRQEQKKTERRKSRKKKL